MKLLKFKSGVALFTSIITLITFAIAYKTPPMSGPFCNDVACYQYPYLDVASRFPRDYYWMFTAIIVLISYIVLMVIISNHTKSNKKLFGQLSVIFTTMSAAVLLITYFTQLSIVQPSLLKNEAGGISLLSQFNPHGLFIALEELGYLLMSISLLFAGFAMTIKSQLQKLISRIFIGSFMITSMSLLVILVTMGSNKEYVFEVAAITVAWFTLILNGFLIFKLFNTQKIFNYEY